MTISQNVLHIKNVCKKFGSNIILNDINLDIEKGSIVGIVGGNGSGKTTLLKLILGFSYVTSGDIEVNGKKLSPGMLGNLPIGVGGLIENPGFLPQFSGLQNLSMLASIRNKINKEDIIKWMKRLGLDPLDKKNVSKYSLGMKQKLGIIQALMENPELVLFDEPTNALDDKSIDIFKNILKEKTREGTAFIIVSHRKDEIYEVCDVVYELNNGALSQLKESEYV